MCRFNWVSEGAGEEDATMARKAKGFRTGHGGQLACPHRDLSCCPDCVRAHVEIVDVCGQHFWIADKEERESFIREMEAPHECCPGDGCRCMVVDMVDDTYSHDV